jgi:2-dehydropantoate 2-reductase
MEDKRSIVVLGAGAVGGYLGGRLAASLAAPRVTLIGRPPLVEAVRARGLRLDEAGSSRTVQLPAVATPAEAEPADLVLLAVRTFDVPDAVPQARALMGKDGLLLAMQNGAGTEDDLANALGRDRVIAGTLTVGVAMDHPGVFTRLGMSGGVALSTMSGSAVPHWVADLFRGTGLPTSEIVDYRSLRWSKLLLNMLGAPATAILNMDMALLVANPSLFHAEQLAFREAGRVMDAQGIPTVDLPGYPVRLARQAMRLPSPIPQRLIGPRMVAARKGRSPVMRRDLERGRTEIAHLNGAVVQAGQRAGVATPVNEVLFELTQELTTHPERRQQYHGEPERLLSSLRAQGIRV